MKKIFFTLILSTAFISTAFASGFAPQDGGSDSVRGYELLPGFVRFDLADTAVPADPHNLYFYPNGDYEHDPYLVLTDVHDGDIVELDSSQSDLLTVSSGGGDFIVSVTPASSDCSSLGGTACESLREANFRFYLGNSSNDYDLPMFMSPTSRVYGCTNPLAPEYSASADSDDGSCTYTPSVSVLYFTKLKTDLNSIDYSYSVNAGFVDVAFTSSSTYAYLYKKTGELIGTYAGSFSEHIDLTDVGGIGSYIFLFTDSAVCGGVTYDECSSGYQINGYFSFTVSDRLNPYVSIDQILMVNTTLLTVVALFWFLLQFIKR